MRSIRPLLVVLVLVTALVSATPARATDRDVKAVMTAGGYGILVGTVAGLIAWPLTGSERAIFMGSSIGLYLGIGAGFYHISNRDEPGNPLRAGPSTSGAQVQKTPFTPRSMRPWVNVALVRF